MTFGAAIATLELIFKGVSEVASLINAHEKRLAELEKKVEAHDARLPHATLKPLN